MKRKVQITKNLLITVFAMVCCICLNLSMFFLANAETAEEFYGVNGEWIYESGGYSPATENAVMQYETKLEGDFKVTMDVTFSSSYATTTDFMVALFADVGSADMAYAYTVAISTTDNTVSVINNTQHTGEIIDVLTIDEPLRDDTARTLSIISYEEELYVRFDGEQVLAGKALLVNEGYLNVSAANISDMVSNFSHQTSYIPTQEEIEQELCFS